MNEKSGRSAAVLCGGLSSRMGRDKALLTVGGLTLIERIFRTASACADDCFLVADKKDKYAFLEAPVVTDSFLRCGPIGGIHAALMACRNDKCLILSCDMPLISEKTIDQLFNTRTSAEIVAAKSTKGIEPVCAIYAKSCLPTLEAQVKDKNYRLMDLLGTMETQIITIEGNRKEESEFMNVNCAADFRRLQTKIK